LGINQPQEFLKAIGEFAVPGKELRAAVHVRSLVYFVLLEPPTHAAWGCVALESGVKAVVHRNNCVS
jgi:hypothetical protein